VPGQVGVDPERLLRVRRPVEQQPGTEGERPVVLRVEVGHRGHGQVEVQHLRVGTLRPRHRRQLGHLLEGQHGAPPRPVQHEPVLPPGVRPAGGRGLVALPVAQPEQLPVELGQRPGVGAVEHHLAQLGAPGRRPVGRSPPERAGLSRRSARGPRTLPLAVGEVGGEAHVAHRRLRPHGLATVVLDGDEGGVDVVDHQRDDRASTGAWRCSMPPPMKPGSPGMPWSSTGRW
jgi:hypothetical protein